MARNGYLAAQSARIERERADAANQAGDLMKWLCLVTTANTCGLSKNKAKLWIDNLTAVFDEFNDEAAEDRDLAIERLRRRAELITGGNVERVD